MTKPSPLPYQGIASFARAPVQELSGDWQADVAFLGVPFDIALGFRPGARFAPRALRESSLRSVPPFTGLDGKTRLADVSLADAGDVILPSLEPELARKRITESALLLRQRCRVPVFLGGDHSISYPLLLAFADVKDLHVLQIDAHLDFTDIRSETRFSNSSPFRRACEDLPNLCHITTLGLRGLRFDYEAVLEAKKRGHSLIPMSEIQASLEQVISGLPKAKNVYISIDVDGLDPALIPATSSPEPDGLSYSQTMKILASTARNNNIVGIDMVELAPNLDTSGRSDLFMSRMIMETLCEVFDA